MNITKLAMVLVVLVFASAPVFSAEGARVASPSAVSSSSSSGDCDDSDAACKPDGGMTTGGAAAVSSPVTSSSSSTVSGSVDQDCDGDTCASPPITTEPSGMAINEKGLPGDKKPKSTK